MKTIAKICILSVIILSLVACGKRSGLRGYIFDKELADAIAPGIDNKQSVYETMGTPSMSSTFSDKTWYYISTVVRTKPLYKPKATARRVMAVSFDDKGVVEGVVNYDLKTARAINPVKDITPTRGKELNFFQQLFMNVGRFSGQQNVGSPGGPGPNGS